VYTNGATAELWATMIRATNRKRVMSMGRSHQRLVLPKKVSSSEMTPIFAAALRNNLIIVALA
jgi:hypothetical protein